MGVIFTVGDDTNDLLVPFVQERNGKTSRDVVNEVYLRASLGKISSRQFWNEVGLGAGYPAVETEYLDAMLTIDDDFLKMAKGMMEKFSLGLLSNDVSEWSRYLRNKFGLDFFDIMVISGDIHCRKPTLGIYRHFLEEAKTQAEACVFIDDRCKNLSAARSVGMKTIHFARKRESGDFVPDASVVSFTELEEAIESILPKYSPPPRTPPLQKAL